MCELFQHCREINELLSTGFENKARNKLIQLLQELKEKDQPYTPLINHLIRETGLFPYIDPNTADWQDSFIYEIFKVDLGENTLRTLHREQSVLLKSLLNGESVAVSAPTSFGKSFVIDAFISIKKPANVVIIVPTIALTDETRRRLTRKFGDKYKIITTPSIEVDEKNIFIFPQERAIGYIDVIKSIDLLIVDEFYKAGTYFDKDRSPVLLKAIFEFSKKAKQRYFLAPNISDLKETPFTKGMSFIKTDFNTVYTQVHSTFGEIETNEEKFQSLLKIITENPSKSLIYVSSHTNLKEVADFLNRNLPITKSQLQEQFSDWLKQNYGQTYKLSDYVKKGLGIHTGRLHRSLAQIQVRLFEENNGLDNIIATSSLIEGINTSAEKVILWNNKIANANLNFFTYKNIIGRGGRMFKHFVGQIYLLEPPPKETEVPLALDFSDNLLFNLGADNNQRELTKEQLAKIISYYEEIDTYFGEKGTYQKLINNHEIQFTNRDVIKSLVEDLSNNSGKWLCLNKLNSNNPNDWKAPLMNIMSLANFQSSGFSYRNLCKLINLISQNWNKTIPQLLSEGNISINSYFEFERLVSFKLASLISDVNAIQQHILPEKIDLSSFVSKLSHAFLPKSVYELEEYGLPRMISKKIQESGLVNLEDDSVPFDHVLNQLRHVGYTTTVKKLSSSNLHPFEEYILKYFFEGIDSKTMNTNNT